MAEASISNPSTPISLATPVSTIQVLGDNSTPISLESITPPSAHVSSSTTDSTETTPSILPFLKNQLLRGAGSQFTFSLETPSLSSGTLDKYLKNVLGHDSMNALPDLLKHNQENITLPPQQPSLPEKPLPDISKESPIDHSKSKEPESDDESAGNSPSNQLATTSDGKAGEVIPIPRGQQYVDITDYLNMPQADAAKKLGIPPSTLSKRWKEAVRKRKWPYRMICKIDKEIMTLLHNVPQGPNAPPLPEEIEAALGKLLRRRQEELRPVVIRI